MTEQDYYVDVPARAAAAGRATPTPGRPASRSVPTADDRPGRGCRVNTDSDRWQLRRYSDWRGMLVHR